MRRRALLWDRASSSRAMLRAFDRVLLKIPVWRRVRQHRGFRAAYGFEETLWTRKVADQQVRRLIATLGPEQLSALEISGSVWRGFGFKSYRQTTFPAFDICADVLPERFDLVIAEHIFEHLLWPSRAARNILAMIRPGGHFLIVTPFLYRVHLNPVDCTRWTETGLRQFLAEWGSARSIRQLAHGEIGSASRQPSDGNSASSIATFILSRMSRNTRSWYGRWHEHRNKPSALRSAAPNR